MKARKTIYKMLPTIQIKDNFLTEKELKIIQSNVNNNLILIKNGKN
tara:strand:- start:316 stop:453 length:138 start_codon:yes stop_codon:yes gene_type:complete